MQSFYKNSKLVEKTIVRFWIISLAYFIFGTVLIYISQSWKIAPVFMGIYMVAISISVLSLLPILWEKYIRKGIAKPTAMLLVLFLFLFSITFTMFGILIGTNGGVGTGFLLKTMSMGGVMLTSYGIIGIVSAELILAIPILNIGIVIKGIPARVAGLMYCLFGSLAFFYFLFWI